MAGHTTAERSDPRPPLRRPRHGCGSERPGSAARLRSGCASKLGDHMGVGREEDLRAVAHHVGDLKRVALLVEHQRREAVAEVIRGRPGIGALDLAVDLRRRDRSDPGRAEPPAITAQEGRRALLPSPSWSDPKATSGSCSRLGADGISVPGGPTSAATARGPGSLTSFTPRINRDGGTITSTRQIPRPPFGDSTP